MMRAVQRAGVGLSVLAALACSHRPDLPPPALPLTQSANEPFRRTAPPPLEGMPVWAPPAVARWLTGKGFRQTQAIAPGETMTLGTPDEGGAPPVEVHAETAAHVGSRYGVDRWRSAANMYLLDTQSVGCFFAGDTALTPDTHRMVAERLSDRGRQLDVALLPIGHAPWWKPGFRRGHLTSDDALELFERLSARFMIPYHWGVFQHVTSGPFDAIRRLRARLGGHPREEEVHILEPGETFELALAGERRRV